MPELEALKQIKEMLDIKFQYAKNSKDRKTAIVALQHVCKRINKLIERTV